MEREDHNQLLSTAKFKPGDIVWTDVKRYSLWPAKVLHVSDEILKIYPCGPKIMQYVEFFEKKEREFIPDDELRPFDVGRATFSLMKGTPKFQQAVLAAKEEVVSVQLGLSEFSIMGIEKTRSFCSGSNLQSIAEFSEAFMQPLSCSSDINNFDLSGLKSCAPSKLMDIMPSSKVVPSKRHFKKKSTFGKTQNKDLNSEDIYEFSESDPLALDLEKNVLKDENAMGTSKSIKTSCLNIGKNITNSDQVSESSLSSRRVSVKRDVPVEETTLDSEINTTYESLNENIDRVTPQVEANLRLNTVPAPFCISMNAKIPTIKKLITRRRGRKSRKSLYMKKSACDRTVEKNISVDAPEKVIKIHYLETKTKVIYPDTKTELNDLPNKETKILGQSAGKTNTNDKIIEEQNTQEEINTQQKSDHMLLTPSIPPPDSNQKLNVGFLGLGGLGKRIVKQLLADGHGVTLWNRSFYKCYEMVDIGAISKRTAEQVVDSCDVTFCCVADTTAVQEVCYSSTGALKGIREGKSLVVLTTIEPQLSRLIEVSVKDRRGLYLEAPMFPAGGEIVDNALMTVVGGSQTCLNNCVPLFRSFVKDLIYVGKVPAGNEMVLLMKTLSAVKIAALAESMALAEKCDVSTDVLFQIFKQTQVASPFLISKAEAMLQSNPWPKDDIFPLSHFSNDLTSTLKLSGDVRIPVIATTKQVYLHSKLRGYSEHDVSAVYLKYTKPL